jgi:hypothetical protein
MQQHHGLPRQNAKHVKPGHERAVVFHEDSAHPSVEAGLWVADVSKPSDELDAILVVINVFSCSIFLSPFQPSRSS